MTEDVNFGHRDQAADIDGESEISRARMVEEVAVRGAALAARVPPNAPATLLQRPTAGSGIWWALSPRQWRRRWVHAPETWRRDHRRHASVSDIADLIRAAAASLLLLSQDDSGSSLRCQVPDFKEMLPGD